MMNNVYNFEYVNSIKEIFDILKVLQVKENDIASATGLEQAILVDDLHYFKSAVDDLIKRIAKTYGKKICDLVNSGIKHCFMNNLYDIKLNNDNTMVGFYLNYREEFGKINEKDAEKCPTTAISVGFDCELEDVLKDMCKIKTNPNGFSPYCIITRKDAGKIVLEEI